MSKKPPPPASCRQRMHSWAASFLSLNMMLLVILSVIWGWAFILIDIAGQAFSLLTLTALRLVLASLFFAPFFALFVYRAKSATVGVYPRCAREWWLLLGIAVFGNCLPFTLVGWAEFHVASVVSAILVATAPIMVLILCHIMREGERVRPVSALGIAVGFCGVIVLFLPQLSLDLPTQTLPFMVLLIVAFSYAFGAILVRKLTSMTPLSIIAFSTVIAALLMVAALPMMSFTMPKQAQPLAALILLALMCTTAAGAMFIFLLQRAGAIFASQCHYLIPCFAALWAMVLLDEVPRWHDLGALVLVMSGIILTQLGTRTRGKRTD